MDVGIKAALIGAMATMVAALFGGFDKLFKRKVKRVSPTRKGELYITFQQLTEMNYAITTLFNQTTADRFLLLISKNDGAKYVWVSAIYEQHNRLSQDSVLLNVGATGQYVKLDTDTDYKEMIEDIRKTSPKRLHTSEMRDCMLKNIYVYEKVTHSNVYFLYDIINEDATGKKDKMTLFCSIAKHGQNNFTQNEETAMKFFVDKIKNEIIPNR